MKVKQYGDYIEGNPFCIELTMSPSVNSAHQPNKPGSKKTVRNSDELVTFLGDSFVKIHNRMVDENFEGFRNVSLCMNVTLIRNTFKGDVDNRYKYIQDSFQRAGMIDNDCRFRKVQIVREVVEGVEECVRIELWAEPDRPISLQELRKSRR